MSLVFTMPGKIGDSLLQWPVVYWYCRQNEVKATLWLDEHTLRPLVNLYASQPCVEAVELKPGIKSYHMGGQPWEFDLTTKDHLDHEIYHLGFRKFPQRQITLEVLDQIPLHIERPKDAKSLMVTERIGAGPRLVLHGNFVTHQSGVPGFWRFISDRKEELEQIFGPEIYFVGTPAERKRARELYPDWRSFDDGGDFLHLAEFIASSSLMIACGSSNVVLAGLLGIPAIRVHDPIGDNPKVIWSNLGENQMNELEVDLRRLWPEFRDKWVSQSVS